MDTSGSHKEGVSKAYKGHDGFAPMAVYLGREGYCIDFEFREASSFVRKTPGTAYKSTEACPVYYSTTTLAQARRRS
ncbi:MAG: hypothetical protein KZQ94_05725 [Candidatus Thiodiazotropha sp. (ex Troendleina suluensis)]|nr:hypothetical protein [Candidatus Thiodiazotropha sp. (ex Troendleina suluensis)]MCU7873139.1 hypothetical protein [Candidatus Thiodiazotropha sp. (ex Lucinoma borealis)]